MFKRIVKGIQQASTDPRQAAGTRRDDDGRDAAAQAGSTLSTAAEALQRGSERFKDLGSSSQRWLKKAASRLPSERPDLKSLTEMARAAKDNVAAQRDVLQARMGGRMRAPTSVGAACQDANERLQAGLGRARSVAASAVTRALGQHLPEARRPSPSPEAIANCDGRRPVTDKVAGDSD